METDPFKQFVRTFTGAYKGLRLYPVHHPAIQRQLQSLVQWFDQFFYEHALLRIGVLEGTLFLDNHLFVEANVAADELAQALQSLGLDSLEVIAGVTEVELQNFMQMLTEGSATDDFAEALRSRGIEHIRLAALQEGEGDDAGDPPRKIYGRALKVVAKIFRDVSLGKVPTSNEAREVVRGMVKVTLSDPHTLFALAMLKDYDNYTFTHSVNVAVTALTVGQACGLDEEQLKVLGLGGLLHDLGKLKIDPRIITKPGRLTAEEFEQIKSHPVNGAEIVRQMDNIPQPAIDIVLGHHVHYDHNGYPESATTALANSPLVAMAAIADTYDAMTTLRSYQRPVTPRSAIARLEKLSGTALHPSYLARFIASLGPYPVGSLVRLDTNEVGLVMRVGSSGRDSVDLKILFDQQGSRLDEPQPRHLEGEQLGGIVAEVDPFLKGVTVTDYFD